MYQEDRQSGSTENQLERLHLQNIDGTPIPTADMTKIKYWGITLNKIQYVKKPVESTW